LAEGKYKNLFHSSWWWQHLTRVSCVK
jgi:hypothetical protein